MNKIGAANSQTRTNSDLVINRKKEKEQHQEWIANGVFVIYTHLAGLAALLFYHPPVWMWTLTFILWMISGLGKFIIKYWWLLE